jgi:hypothetical protein
MLTGLLMWTKWIGLGLLELISCPVMTRMVM